MNGKISIVTINYNASGETIDFLNALKEQTEKSFDVILVDNGSSKVDLDALNVWLEKTYIPGLSVLKNGENSGFSGGCNIGIKKALENGSEWVVLLNNDTLPDSRFIVDLRAVLKGKEGLIGIPMDEGLRIAFCGKIGWLKPTLNHTHEVPKKLARYYVIGGGVAIHRSVFDEIGFLDESYFLYFEDADFSIRATRAKLPISIAKEIKVRHLVSVSTKKLGSPSLFRYHYRNALYFNRKLGPWWIKILLWPWSWQIILKQSFKIVIRKDLEYSKSILNGVLDFYRNKMGKIQN